MGTKTQKLSNVVDQIVEWQSVFTGDGSTGLTAVAGRGYFIDTTSGTVTVTLPASPKIGDIVQLKDYARTWGTNAVSIASAKFDGVAAQTPSFSTQGQTVTLVYMDGTKGWSLINEDTTTSLGSLYVTATGGTVTESGDYKIHTFTGDGCFVVSCAGNPVGSDSVEVLAVGAGGGGGGDNGGGGAGGSVASNTSASVTATTYPISIGAGGTGGDGSPNPTSDGGNGNVVTFFGNTVRGGSGGRDSCNAGGTFPGTYSNGGGGAGVDDTPASTAPGVTGVAHPAISGYTISTSNSGGIAQNAPSPNPGPGNRAGGGAGSGAAGSNASPAGGGPGGIGTLNNICGGSYYWAGGGGGGTNNDAGGNGGNGGGGGGGSPTASPSSVGTGGAGLNGGANGIIPTNGGGAGGANTGGGGGGAGRDAPGNGGNGGSGIVIIKYKFQN